jgi:long-chain acyl-CoA synthetase
MLSHGNIIANVESCRETKMARQTDTFLSILPLSHMFERTGGYYLPLAIGAKVVYARGVAQIADDLAEQAPTAMFAVPRIFEKFLARVNQSLASAPAKRWLFDQCVARGWRVECGNASWLDVVATPMLRSLVAKPIFASLGSRMRLAVVGGAALDPVISHTFIRLGLAMLQGTDDRSLAGDLGESLGDNDPDSAAAAAARRRDQLSQSGELFARGGMSCAVTGAMRKRPMSRSMATVGCIQAMSPRSATAGSTFADA